MEKKRLAFLDYAKALAIIFVLMDHLWVECFIEYESFLLPVFFISFGYTANLEKETFGKFTKVRFKRLILPFWGLMLLDIPLEIVKAYYYGYNTCKIAIPALLGTVYGSAGKLPDVFGLKNIINACLPYLRPQDLLSLDTILPSNCHLWFLPAMFTASILFYVILKRFRDKNITLIILSVLLLFVTALESMTAMPQLPYGIGRGCMGAVYMFFGYKLKESSFFEKGSVLIKTIVFILSFVIALIFIKIWDIQGGAYVRSYYGPYGLWSTYLTFIGGAFAAMAVLTFFRLLEQFGIGKVGLLLSTIGQSTMALYLWQFFVFFPLDVLYLKLSGATATPGKFYWMAVLPESAMWYRFIEASTYICLILLIIKFYKQKSKSITVK